MDPPGNLAITGAHASLPWSPAAISASLPTFAASTGYGIEFQKANYKDLGGGDLQDEVFAAKFLQATGYVNPNKIGITGGSYSGLMTLMAIGKTPDVWAAAVQLFGIINCMTMLKHSDPMLQQYEQSLLGDPVKDHAVYDAASPVTYIHNVKAPLLVLQGANDPACHKKKRSKSSNFSRRMARQWALTTTPTKATASKNVKTRLTPSAAPSPGSTNTLKALTGRRPANQVVTYAGKPCSSELVLETKRCRSFRGCRRWHTYILVAHSSS